MLRQSAKYFLTDNISCKEKLVQVEIIWYTLQRDPEMGAYEIAVLPSKY
jgi:hypothetical protein